MANQIKLVAQYYIAANNRSDIIIGINDEGEIEYNYPSYPSIEFAQILINENETHQDFAQGDIDGCISSLDIDHDDWSCDQIDQLESIIASRLRPETKYCHGGCRQTPISKFALDPDGRYCDDCMRDDEVVGDWRDDNHAQHYGVDA